ncbi:MAG: hypothetical protein IMY67_00995 [Bacteroidetes bacterium]|nr:hypothetical protein [Bacteroidota bacterium]
MNVVSTLQEKINNAGVLDFGTIFSESIELFKKTWLQGVLLQIFTIIVMLPIIIILFIPLITMVIAEARTGYSDSSVYSDFFAGMSILYILFVIIGILVLGAVSVALNAAFFRIMKKLDYNEQVTTSDFFYFLNGTYLSKTFVIMLVSILIAIPSALMCYIPLIYMIVPLSFFTLIFAFNPNLSIGDIVSISFKLGHKKWLLTFGLLLVSWVITSVIGAITCGLASLFIAAFIYHPVYLIYKDVIGFDNGDEINILVEEN